MTLADKIEALDAPSREADAEIALAIAWRDCIPCDLMGVKSRMGKPLAYPHYTASIDAAVTLVPEGWLWAVTNAEAERGSLFRATAMVAAKPDDVPNPVEAATPAIALAAAALRAKGEG